MRPTSPSPPLDPHPLSLVQAVDRALIVDTLPSAEQADANAWAARMLGFGSVAGYFMYVDPSNSPCSFVHQYPSGNVDMTAVFPIFGNTELEVLAVVGSLLLLITHSVTAFCTKEKIVVSSRCVLQPTALTSGADREPEIQINLLLANSEIYGRMPSPSLPLFVRLYVSLARFFPSWCTAAHRRVQCLIQFL